MHNLPNRCSTLLVFAVCLARAIAAEPCATCGAPQFPEAQAYLEAQGFPAAQYRVLLAWREAVAKAPGGVLDGFHVGPVAGGEPFDLFRTSDGTLLDQGDVQRFYGFAPKNWHLKPQAVDAEPVASPKTQALPPRPVSVTLKAAPLTVELPKPDVAKAEAEDAQAASLPHKGPQRLGLLQTLETPLRLTATDASLGAWQSLPDGSRVWSVVLDAVDARGQRVHFTKLALPQGARMVMWNADDVSERYGPFTEVADTTNGLWTPTCFASRMGLECVVPAGVDASGLVVDADRTVYLYRGLDEMAWTKAAGSCNLDATCYSAWSEPAKAVGGIGTIGATGFLWCTGTLIADGDPTTQVPYFLTAAHCVDTLAEASSMEIYWLYQSATCGGSVPSPSSVPRTATGADYLVGTSMASGTDFTLVRLRSQPPSGVMYSGWSSQTVAAGTSVVGIHHPRGDYKRISFGVTDNQSPAQDGLSTTRFVGVTWSMGVTEPGSSGSPIFDSITQRLLGQLWGGGSSCSQPHAPDSYGRFSESYTLAQNYLAPHFSLTSPNGGERFRTGDSVTISWTTDTLGQSSVKLELLRGSSAVATIAGSILNTGSYAWTVPAGLTAGSDYRIRITSLPGATQTDTSDAAFDIATGPVPLSISPDTGFENGGDTVQITGFGFRAVGTSVRFDGQPATSVQIIDATYNPMRHAGPRAGCRQRRRTRDRRIHGHPGQRVYLRHQGLRR